MSSIALRMDAPVASAARAGRLWLATSRMLLLGLSLLFLLFAITGIRVGMTVQAGVYLFGMVALNLPHGGFEHYLNLQARRTRFTFGYLAAFLLLIGLFALFFLSFPVGGLALALAVAMAKGGGADLKVMEACTGDAHLRGRGSRLLAGVARGVPIMLLPILFFPGDFRFYSGLMVDLFAPGALGPLDGILLAARPWLGGLAFALIAAHLLRGATRAGRGPARARRAWKHDALDTGLLVLFFTTVPVVLAVGLYFPLWYSARQIARSLAAPSTKLPAPSDDPPPAATRLADAPAAILPEPRLAGTDMDRAGYGERFPRGVGKAPTSAWQPTDAGTDIATPAGQSFLFPGEEELAGNETLPKDSSPSTFWQTVLTRVPWVGSGQARAAGRGAAGEGGRAREAGVAGRDPGRAALYAWAAMMVGAGVTLVLAVGLWLVLPHLPSGLPWLMVGVAFWTVFISIVALPHVVIGEWLDREGGIWSSVLSSHGSRASGPFQRA